MIDIKDFILQLEDTTLSLEEQQAALAMIEQSLIENKQLQEKSLEESSTLIADAVKLVEDNLNNKFEALKTDPKLKGPKGDQGIPGPKGNDGRDGLNGINGVDGKDGVDGVDGKDGRYVTNVEVDIDDTLLVTLSDGTKIKTVKEIKGPKGDQGPQGLRGSAGAGIIAGGTTGQVLAKASSSDYDMAWTTVSGGGTPGGSNTQIQFNNSGAFAGSPNLAWDGTSLSVGAGTPLTGATNPLVSMEGNANGYVQSYVINNSTGTSASSDFTAYANNSTDAHGWADIGFTSSTYADATYTVTGPNEAYLLGSALNSTYTGNLVYATDSTGSANAHQWYVGGFTQAKSAWKMQLTSTEFQLANNLNFAGTNKRILGDMSNATAASRVHFQTSTVNGSTSLSAIPNGTGTSASLQVHNSSDPDNASYGQITANPTNIAISSFVRGTGAQLPFRFNSTGGTQFEITHTASPVNYLSSTGSITTTAPVLSAQGADTNISINLTPKGTGNVVATSGAFSGTHIGTLNTTTVSDTSSIARAGGLTAVTTIASTTTYTTGGVTLPNQIAVAGGVWRVRAIGNYVAANSATARNARLAIYWGTATLLLNNIPVLINTAKTSTWSAEVTLTGSSTTALWITSQWLHSMSIAGNTSILLGQTPASLTVTSGAQTIDLRFSMNTVVTGDAFEVQSVTIERLE